MLVARLAMEVIRQQIAHGAKHPSPGLIKEAVATAHAVVKELDVQLSDEHVLDLHDRISAGLDDRIEARLAKMEADSKDALDGKVNAAAAAAVDAQAKASAKTAAALPSPSVPAAPVAPVVDAPKP